MEGADLELFDRSVRHATERGSGDVLDVALADLGWRDALRAETRTAVSLLFEYQGAANVTSSSLDRVLAVGLGVADDRAPTALLPPVGTRLPPGRMTGDRCALRGLATADPDRADPLLVVAEAAGGHAALTVPPAVLSRRRVDGIDPSLGLCELTGEIALENGASQVMVDWTGAVALGQLALGHELVGAARAMLELARTHASDRIQFGRPIATFQAVRHRLADALVAIEAAAALLAAAWDQPSPVNAAIAKSSAGRGARTVARHCQQVLAGVGFTTEHPFHRYYRRILLLDQLLGAGSALTAELGTEVLRTRTLPPVLSL